MFNKKRLQNKDKLRILDNPTISYCLYARKSSESDERQAMSIDSQIQEMKTLAVRENIFIKEVREESHSAKESGQRPARIENIQVNIKTTNKKLLEEIERFHSLRKEVLKQEYLAGKLNQFDYPKKEQITEEMMKAYILHVLKVGTADERQQILSTIKTKFVLRNRELRI